VARGEAEGVVVSGASHVVQMETKAALSEALGLLREAKDGTLAWGGGDGHCMECGCGQNYSGHDPDCRLATFLAKHGETP
jgi:hypothetical protein